MDKRDHYSKDAGGLALCWQVKGYTKNLHPIVYTDHEPDVTCTPCKRALVQIALNKVRRLEDERFRYLAKQSRKLQGRTLELEISHLPDSRLSPNARVHWTAKHSATSRERSEVGWLAKSQWIGNNPMLYAVIEYEFIVPVSRRRDEDNFVSMAKPWQDGLVDAGVLTYDDSEHVKIGDVIFNPGPLGLTRITVIEIAEKLIKGGC